MAHNHCVYEQFFISYCTKDRPFKSYHQHNMNEIVLVEKGESIAQCSGQILHVTAPAIIFYPADMPHFQNNIRNEYARWCFPLAPSFVGWNVELPKRFFAIQLTELQYTQLREYVRIMERYWKAAEGKCEPLSGSTASVQEETRLKYLLLLFLNELRPLIPDTVPAKSSYINDVCLYISENPAERFTLDSLAERYFVGRATLTKDFRRGMGMSVVEFITTVRINHAKALLQEGLPLGEISEQCGFSSVSYFIKVFIRHTGLSPTRYRAALDELPPE
ncbi:MAG: helix-turn-helix transcriptional regulator [Clostridia bacterium]|nr:helix-turn-helix transcriptional regulator [Clostridia bacterium]